MMEKDIDVEKLVDEIVDEILSSQKVPSNQQVKTLTKNEGPLEGRLAVLEKTFQNYMGQYRTFAVEIERELTEKIENLQDENEKQILDFQVKLSSLREDLKNVVRELKRVKDSVRR